MSAVLLLMWSPKLTLAQEGADFGSFAQPGSGGVDVDLHSGSLQFSLPAVTIPGAQGEGYVLTLGYHGPSPSEEASWVGTGWSFSPGAITRSVSGIPDDYDGASIVNINKHAPYTQIKLFPTAGVEAYNVKASGKVGVAIDSKRGVLLASGLGLGGYGAGLSIQQTGDDVGASFSFNPYAAYKSSSNLGSKDEEKTKDLGGLSPLVTPAIVAMDWVQEVINAPRITKALIDANKKKVGKQIRNSISLNWSPSRLTTLSVSPNGMSTVSGSFSADFQGDFLSTADVGGELGFQGSFVIQKEDPLDVDKAFGYLHSHSDDIGEFDRMDFSEDMPGAVAKGDQYLPMPVGNPDRFSVQALGLSGSMRLHNTLPIQWKDRGLKRGKFEEPSINAGIEVSLGPVYIGGLGVTGSGGGNAGLGFSWEMELGEWVPSTSHETEGLFYFAFDGDAGHIRKYGDWGGAMGDNQSLSFASQKSIKGPEKKELEWNDDPYAVHAPYRLPELMKSVAFGPVESSSSLAPLNEDLTLRDSFYENAEAVLGDSELGAFRITSEQGAQYVFGLPVLVRNQSTLSMVHKKWEWNTDTLVDEKVVMLSPEDANRLPDFDSILKPDEEGRVSADSVTSRLEADENWKQLDISGTIMPHAFAKQFLLTAIYSPDYRDLTSNGPTEDDFGTYVRFAYDRKYGGNGDWFRSRSPIEGMWYSEGSIPDSRDDALSMSFEESEVYVLDSIETKTHYAVFFHSERMDMTGVKDFRCTADGKDSGDSGAKSYRCDSVQVFRKLVSGDELLSTTRFSYDYSLCNDHPNSVHDSGSAGRLTLREVNASTEDVVDVVSRSQFDYQYPSLSDLPAEVLDRYGDFFTHHSAEAGLEENPDFAFNHENAWGVMRSDEPFDKEWRYGWEAGVSKSNYDPAAYYLKQIHLSSGATVLPQYESGEYRNVHGQPVHMMVRVKEEGRKELRVNAADLEGGTPSEWGEHLQTHFASPGQGRLYFNLLYHIANDNEGQFNGFAQVDDVEWDSEGVSILLKDTGEFALPRQLCRNYRRDNPRVLVTSNDSEFQEDTDVLKLAVEALGKLGGIVVGGAGAVEGGCTCDSLNSYVRLPALPGQVVRGGAPRVARLLHLDRGLEEGDAMLFGRQFTYSSLSESQSSGVASDLPARLTDENPLFYPLPNINRKKKTRFRLIAGRALSHGTGPLAESFMPSPQVTYAEVVESKIHSGKSAEGFMVSRFWTHEDEECANHVEQTEPSQDSGKDDLRGFERNVSIPLSPLSYSEKRLFKTQGYRVFVSSLPGSPKEQVTYRGSFSDPDSWSESSRTEYEYLKPHETVSKRSGWTHVSGAQPGHFEEVCHLGRRVTQESRDASASLDIGGSVASYPGPPSPPIYLPDPKPSLGVIPWFTWSQNSSEYATHVTTTVVRLPATLKSITTTSASKEQTIEHVAFDAVTGSPVIVTTTDGFTGEEWQGLDSEWDYKMEVQTLPAHAFHTELGPKSLNEGKILTSGKGELEGIHLQVGASAASGSCSYYLELTPYSAVTGDRDLIDRRWRAMDNFHPGDALFLSPVGSTTQVARAKVSKVRGNRAYLSDWYLPSSHPSSLSIPNINWTSSAVEVTVLRSGRQNQLGLGSGAVSHYSDGTGESLVDRTPSGMDVILCALNAALPDPELDWQTSGPYTSAISYSAGSCVSSSPGGNWADTLYVEEAGGSSLSSMGGMCLRLEAGGRGFVSLGSANCTDSAWTGAGCNASGDGPKDPGNGSLVIPIHHSIMTIDKEIGQFEWDGSLGAIVWTSPDNPGFPVPILTPVDPWWNVIQVPNVVSASATVWRDEVPYQFSPSGELDARGAEVNDDVDRYSDPYAFGLKGRWRPVDQLVYNQDATGITSVGGGVLHSTTSGLMTEFEDINRNRIAVDGRRWIQASGTLAYDEHGRPLEVADALDHRSSTRFGLDDKLPIWAARNAAVSECFFESCESFASTRFTDSGLDLGGTGHLRPDTLGHSGSACIKLAAGDGSLALPAIKVGQSMSEAGARLRFWMHDAGSTNGEKCKVDSLFTFELSGTSTALEAPVDSLAQTGAWVLLESVIPTGLIMGTELEPVLKYERSGCPSSSSGPPDLFVDDIKVQPARSLMVCTVYDPVDYKVLATLDENHFGTYRRYNARNEHVRTAVETLEGLKTVVEKYMHQKNLD